MKTEILLSGNSGNTEKEIRGGWRERLERKRESSIGNLEIARARRKWWNTRKHGIIFNFDLERPTLEIPVIAVKSREAARGLGTTPSPPRGVKKRERKTVKRGKRGGGNGNGGGGEGGGGGGGRKGKVENRIIVQRRPRCRLGADEKEEMKWTVRLTGIYILSCAICVSELCRVTVRRIRSGKSVIITRATLAEASLLFPPTSSSPLSHPPPFATPVSTLGSPSPSVTRVSLHPRCTASKAFSLLSSQSCPFPIRLSLSLSRFLRPEVGRSFQPSTRDSLDLRQRGSLSHVGREECAARENK